MDNEKKCLDCSVTLVRGENIHESLINKKWYLCKSCNNNNRNPKTNNARMYVNGQYISFRHPLYKAGRYKNFNDAAFSSLKNYAKVKEGEVYAITNDAWPEWVKIGMAIDSEDRLSGYQTSSPFRDYTLHYTASFEDRRKAETQAHKIAGTIAEEQKNEWFKMDTKSAIDIISSLN
tara:strand:- start:248 stop:775 length:528 start_codon:yes stop_codon:yes gene_type:complete